MSAESELLIKIRTILESQGLDAAKAKLNELADSQNATGLSQAAASNENEKAAIKAEKTAKAILAMNNAMAGGMGPFRAAVSVANQLGGEFALLAFKASAVGAAIGIGWKMGAALRDWVTGAKDVAAEMEKIKKVSDDLRDRVSKLSEIRLNNLKIQAEDIAKGFSTAVDKAERLKGLSDLREDATLASDLAGLELRFQNKEIDKTERDRLEIKYTHDSQMRKNAAEEKRIISEEELSYSTESQARGRQGSLSRKSGMAQQEYDQTVESLKTLGISDPEALIAEGADSEKYQKLLANTRDRLKYAKSQQKANRENPLVNHDLQGPIDDRRVSSAQQVLNGLSELPSLKTARDSAKKAVEENRPKTDEVLLKESIKREQLDADKDVLIQRYRQTSSIKDSGLKGVQNRLNDEFDKAAEETQSPKQKARKIGQDLLDFTLGFQTRRDNAGLPLSSSGQKEFDSSRLRQANDLAKSAVNKAYNGGDPNVIMSELLDALQKIAARPSLREDQIQAILTDIRNLKGQQQTAPGLN